MASIKIKGIRKRVKKPTDFSQLDSTLYRGFDLLKYVTDSRVNRVWIQKKVIGDIECWVNKSLKDKPVKEVGGFLFGRVAEPAETGVEVSVDHFIPDIDVDFNSPNRLEFGSMVQKTIDHFSENNEDMVLVGWFHTHPGIGPYLSQTDLRLHLGFLTESYQLAIVLDSLTPSFDTGIFSRKSDGSMNNKTDFKTWISWKEVSNK